MQNAPRGPKTRRERGRREDRRSRPVYTAVLKQNGIVRAAQECAEETGRLLMVHSGAVWNSAGGGQRPQQLAEEFADEACVVHLNCANPTRFQQPVTAPCVSGLHKYEQWFDVQAESTVFYTSFPDGQAWAMIGETPRDWGIWYDCVDLWDDFDHNDWYSARRERAICEAADLVTCTSDNLCEHVRDLTEGRVEPRLLPNSTRLVGQPHLAEEPQFDLVFVGWLADDWIDWPLVRRLAEKHSILIIGPLPDGGKPFEHENVEWAGQVSNDELLCWLEDARVGIVPFRDLPLVHAVWPIKYADYLAAGIPTVAAHMPALEAHRYVDVAYSQEAFIEAVATALARPPDPERVREEAEAHTAQARVRQAAEWLSERGVWA